MLQRIGECDLHRLYRGVIPRPAVRGGADTGQHSLEAVEREQRGEAVVGRRELPHRHRVSVRRRHRVGECGAVPHQVLRRQHPAAYLHRLHDGVRHGPRVEAIFSAVLGESSEGAGELGVRLGFAGARRSVLGLHQHARRTRGAQQVLLALPQLGRDWADGRSRLRQLDGGLENIREGELARPVARHHVLPHRRRAGHHDAQRVGAGYDLTADVASGSNQIQRQSSGAGSAALHGGDLFAGGVEQQGEGVTTDTRARGLAHVERRRHRHSSLTRGTALSQDAKASFGGERLTRSHHASGCQSWGAPAVELDGCGGATPRLFTRCRRR